MLSGLLREKVYYLLVLLFRDYLVLFTHYRFLKLDKLTVQLDFFSFNPQQLPSFTEFFINIYLVLKIKI